MTERKPVEFCPQRAFVNAEFTASCMPTDRPISHVPAHSCGTLERGSRRQRLKRVIDLVVRPGVCDATRADGARIEYAKHVLSIVWQRRDRRRQ
jgi:hypothetical protein